MKRRSLFLATKNRRGQVGFNIVIGVVSAVITLVVLSFAALLVMSSLRNSGVFTAGSLEANATTQITGNTSTALSTFFGSMGTVFAVLVAVIIILAVSIIILVTRRFGTGGGGATV